MSDLFALLKAAGGEKQLSSQFMRWAQVVSKILSGSPGTVFDYVQALRVANQTGVTTGVDVLFDTVAEQSGVPYDPATGLFALTANKTYQLSGLGTMISFAGGTDEIDLEWVDSSNAPLVANAVGLWKPVSNGLVVAPANQVVVVHRPTVSKAVKLRCTGSSGSATILGKNFTAVVQQISG